MTFQNKLNNSIITNFANTKLWYTIVPILAVSVFLLYILGKENAFTINYVNVQKNIFFELNSRLSIYSKIQYNLTQLGDVIVVFPLLSILVIHAPKFWKALITSSIISLFISAMLKKTFAVPRPAAVLDTDYFTIVGKTLKSNTSLPSGHSITILIIFTTILYAFMPKKNSSKFLWYIIVLSLGITIAFSRVAVGAHYPIDVLIGSAIGYSIGVLGIVISRKYTIPTIKNNCIAHYILLGLSTLWAVVISFKIYEENLFIFYVSFGSLLLTIFLILKTIKCLQKN